MFKRYLSPLICLLIALLLFLGNSTSRLHKAAWLSRTLLFPFSQSLIRLESLQKLQQENNVLQYKLANQTLETLELRNQLRLLQNYQAFRYDLQGVPYAMAEVMGYSGQFSNRTLIINKGSRDGLESDSPVVSASGIVGKVITVSAGNSVVLPVNHTQFQLAVMDQSTNVQGILQSDGTGFTYMNLIKLGSQLSVGDTVVTSNLSTIFPKGFPVGRISRIKESQDNLFLSAQIELFALIENIEYVFILKKSYLEAQRHPVLNTPVADTLR